MQIVCIQYNADTLKMTDMTHLVTHKFASISTKQTFQGNPLNLKIHFLHCLINAAQPQRDIIFVGGAGKYWRSCL